MAAQFHVPVSAVARTVYVSNISASASDKQVSEFFAFCGAISAVQIVAHAADSRHGVVTFDQPSAWQTAQLLSGARIVDRAILVEPYVPAAAADAAAGATPAGATAAATAAAPPVVAAPPAPAAETAAPSAAATAAAEPEAQPGSQEAKSKVRTASPRRSHVAR